MYKWQYLDIKNALWESAKLSALHVVAPMRVTPSLIIALRSSELARLCTLSIINMPLMRLVRLLGFYSYPLELYVPLSFSLTNSFVSVNKKFNIVRNDLRHTQRCKFSVLDQKHPFWTNLLPKIKTIMQNSMVMFNFSFLVWKNSFWVYLVQKIKIVSLN